MPAALPFIAVGASILGTGIGAISAIRQGSAQSAALRSQAGAARYNQTVAEMNAQAVLNAGAYREKIQREKNKRLLASQQTGFAKGGVTMEGTPLEVMADTAADQERDIIAERYNTNIQAWRFRSQAQQFGFESSRDLSMASGPETAGWIGAGSTLLTGAGRALAPFMGGSGSSAQYDRGGFDMTRGW